MDYLDGRVPAFEQIDRDHPWLNSTLIAMLVAASELAPDAVEDYVGAVLRYAQTQDGRFRTIPLEAAVDAARRVSRVLEPLLPPPEVSVEMEWNDYQIMQPVELGISQGDYGNLLLNAKRGVSFSDWLGHHGEIFKLERNTTAMEKVARFYRSVAAAYQAQIDAEAAVRRFETRNAPPDPVLREREQEIAKLKHQEEVLGHLARIQELETKLTGGRKRDWKSEYDAAGQLARERSGSFHQFQIGMLGEKHRHEKNILSSEMSDADKSRMLADLETFNAELMAAAAKDFARMGLSE